ncbi:MAG: protein kinase [Planctomycetes bacterium]|nr:protein kinase [Planctomycetota bacterium]
MSQFGKYTLEGEIARGGMGVVYRARDEAGRAFAIKVLLAGQGASEVQRKRFEREGQALLRLRHVNVVRFHEAGVHESAPYLVMDLLEGERLDVYLKGRGRLEGREAAQILEELSRGVHHVHERGLLHRDLKPENVILVDGSPRLTDFGLTRDVDPRLSGTQLSVQGQFMGTPGYWPPEQARGQLAQVGVHSDVYGLGALLYALLTGRPPHVGATLIEIATSMESDPERPSSLNPQVSASLEAICLRCLELDPQRRYASAKDLALDLGRFRAGELEPGGVSRAVLIGGLALTGVVIAALVGGGVALRGGAEEPSSSLRPAASQTPSATPKLSPSASPSPAPSVAPMPRPPALPKEPRPWTRVLGAGQFVAPDWFSAGPRVLARVREEGDPGTWFEIRPSTEEMIPLPAAVSPGTIPAWDSTRSRLLFVRKEGDVVAWDGKALSPFAQPGDPASIAVSGDRVLIGTRRGQLFAYRADGTALWNSSLGGRLDAVPLALDLDADGADDHVVVASSRGELGLFDLDRGGRRGQAALPGPVRFAPVVVASAGTAPVIVVACSNGYLVRFAVTSGGFGGHATLMLPAAIETPLAVAALGGPRESIVALGLSRLGLVAVRADLSACAWGSQSPAGALLRGGPIAIDVSGDRRSELVCAWFLPGSGRGYMGEATLRAFDAEGRAFPTLGLGSRRVGLAKVGPRRLVAGGEALEQWVGLAGAPEERTPGLKHAEYLLMIGAWEAAQREARGVGPQGDLVAALADACRGDTAALQAMSPEEKKAIWVFINRRWVRSRSLNSTRVALERIAEAAGGKADPLEPFPLHPVRVLRHVSQPHPILAFKQQKSFGHGITRLEQTESGRAGTLQARGRLRVGFETQRGERVHLQIRHGSLSSHGVGAAFVTLRLDGELVLERTAAPWWLQFSERVDLGYVLAGDHVLEISVSPRSSTVYKVTRIEIVPSR